MSQVDDKLILDTFEKKGVRLDDSLITKSYLNPIQPTAAASDQAFTGDITYVFYVTQGSVFVPSRSYIQLTATTTSAVDTQMYAFAASGSLYTSMWLEYNDEKVSEINSNYAQINAYRIRTHSINNVTGNAYLDATFRDMDGKDGKAHIVAGGANRTFIHRPALDIFAEDEPIVLLPGKYTLHTIVQNVKEACFTMNSDKATATAATFVVNSVKFMAAIADVSKAPPLNVTYLTKQIECRKVGMGGASGEYSLQVDPQTDKISIATQLSGAGTSEKKIPPSVFCGLAAQPDEQRITSLSVQLGTAVQPPSGAMNLSYNGTDFKTQNYTEGYMSSQAIFGYSTFGAETFYEWMGVGPIFSFDFVKSRGTNSADCVVRVTSSAAPTSQNLLVFSESPRIWSISFADKTMKQSKFTTKKVE